MSYLVLARKYRPHNFNEVVGQSHITDILKNAIKIDRLGQAYLFCGPRGIGKTSCARILAKALNCEKGVTSEPCDKCSACESIAKGNSFDVLEIDGASNRGIDEIRTIRENVKFAPSYGRYKIYIVDEVHMLTPEAFNALLKTLEEPPEHVKFIFATTDPNKLPATIISRCQRFDFKRISFKELCVSLEEISKKEKIRIDQDAIYAIAKSGRGSFRDALSVLDQVSALSEKGIKGTDVYSMLGLVELDLLFLLIEELGRGNCAAVLNIFDSIIDHGKDVKQLGKDLIEHLRHLMILKIGGASMEKIKELGRLVDYPAEIKDSLLKLAQGFQLNEILSAIDIFIEAQEMARIMESERTSMEIAFAKLTLVLNRPPIAVTDSVKKVDAKVPELVVPGTIIKNKKGQVNASDLNDAGDGSDVSSWEPAVDQTPKLAIVDPTEEKLSQVTTVLSLEGVKSKWSALTHAVSRERMSLATYLQEGAPIALMGNKLVIGFLPAHAFFKETLETNINVELVERAFFQEFNEQVLVRYEISQDVRPINSEEDQQIVKEVLDAFGGEIESRWHNE